MKRNLLLFLLLILSAAAMAQVPQAMTYQSVLRGADGTLLASRTVSVRMSIMQGSPAGTAVYVETHRTATNANGLYTLRIGEGTAVQGTFSAIDWAAGPYFAVSETDPDGGTDYRITTTQQLLSVPYALYAQYAASSPNGGGTGSPSADTVVINNVTRDTLYIFDTVFSASDTIYQITAQRDTVYSFDTIFSASDTIYQITSQRDTVYQITSNTDTIYSITSNNDTIYQIDTIYSIVNNRDTIHSFDTIYHQTTNTDTVYQVTSQRDTVYQITSNTDTIYSITSNNDTIYQIDTIYSIVNNRDTIHSFDT
ncbi:MAG: hypothetical protein IJR13_09305, partial [Bacteroidales bacterium]|nr:hypothetical protein [Bacteroidales bacterium]